MGFDFSTITEADRELFTPIIGSLYREPDLIITNDDANKTPYLYRWWVLRSEEASVYAHIQVGSDPARPLHDHPWDNMSVILSGGYVEKMNLNPRVDPFQQLMRSFKRRKGDVVFRKAEWAHRLILPTNVPYTMTLFSSGPTINKWGFWIDGVHHPYKELTTQIDGRSIWHGPSLDKETDDAQYTL